MYIELGTELKGFGKNDSGILPMSYILEKNLDLYSNIFECRFLEETGLYYSRYFPKEMSEKCYTDIIDLIKGIFDKELERADVVLHHSSKAKLISTLVNS